MVVTVRLTNYKGYENFEFKPDRKSFFVVGDTGQRKTILIDAIRSSLMLIPFDTEPLSAGAESGSVSVAHDFGDGHIYTITRRFTKKGLIRFEVIDENGGEHKSLKAVLDRIFGKAFTNSYFDYTEYFHRAKSTEKRSEYFTKTIGGEQSFNNTQEIKALIKQRQGLDKDIKYYETHVLNSILDPEILDEQEEIYKDPKTIEAINEYEPLLKLKEQLIDKDILQQEFDMVKQANDKWLKAEARVGEIDVTIQDLKKQISELTNDKKQANKFMKDFPSDLKLQEKMEQELADADKTNAELAPEIELVKRAGIDSINQFNRDQLDFQTGIKNYEKLVELEGKHETIQSKIDGLVEANKKIIQEKIAVPGLVYDSENDIVLYTGDDGVQRELCYPNVSTGRSINIASQIQRAMNPNGNNFIVVPEGQSLGSELDEVIAECNKFGVQYIVEVTERKQALTVKFEEEYLNPKPEKPVKREKSTDVSRKKP